MMQYRVKHLEPIHIEYINEWKHALVTEDGSKFYPNDLVYHKSIDTMIQKLDEKDKELVILWSKAITVQGDSSKKGIFYMNEQELDDYCAQSLKYLENSDSEESRFVRNETMKKVQQDRCYDLAQIEQYFEVFPKKFKGSADDKKIRENWKSRGISNGEGIDGREVVRILTILKLAEMNVSKGVDMMSNLKKYQRFNKERKVIMRIMCDKRIEDYDEWFLCCEEVLEACCSILEEEGKLEASLAKIHIWNSFNHRTNRQFAPVSEFKQLLPHFEIDQGRFTLVPDIHFIRQWIELPLSMDYTCATVLGSDGKEYYRPIQAQLHVFERLGCDIDWEAAHKENPRKSQQMVCKIVELMETCSEADFYSPEVIEAAINRISTNSFFAESRKRAMKAPLYMCRKKNYNDYMPMSEFKKIFKMHYHDIGSEDGFWKTDKVEICKARYIFLAGWIDMVLSNYKELFVNIMAAISFQIGFVHLADKNDMAQFCMANDLNSFLDYRKINMFEEMAEKSRIKTLVAPVEIVPQEPSKKSNKKKNSNLKRGLDKADEKKPTENIQKKDDKVEVAPKKKCVEVSENEESKKTVNDQSPKKTLEKESKVAEMEPEVSEVEKCPSCDEKEKKFNDEIEILKRQLAEQSKLLEDQTNRSKSDALRIQQLQNELGKSQKMMAQQEENAKELQKSLRDQANKIKQDYKAENQKLKQSLENKENRIKQLDMELKECRENAKNEQKKRNSEADSESKIATTTMKKMKTELEMAKLTETTNFKKINKLEKENGELKTQLEILEEQSSTDSEKEERIQELTRKCQDLKLENMGLSADVEELTVKNQGFEKLALKNHELMAEIDRLKILSSEIEIKNSQPSICSKCSSINGTSFAEFHSENCRDCPICIDDIDNNDQHVRKCKSCRAEYHGNCLSEWLNINPTCPNCRVHWPNPQEFPAL